MQQPTEKSYILRKYFKGFLPSQSNLFKIAEKRNKINRGNFLSSVITQNKQIYQVISSNYKNTYDLIDKITTHMNNIRLKFSEHDINHQSSSFIKTVHIIFVCTTLQMKKHTSLPHMNHFRL